MEKKQLDTTDPPPWGSYPSDTTWCSECEYEVDRCDEDGCCIYCGADLFVNENGEPLDTAWGRWLAAEQKRYAEMTDGSRP